MLANYSDNSNLLFKIRLESAFFYSVYLPEVVYYRAAESAFHTPRNCVEAGYNNCKRGLSSRGG